MPPKGLVEDILVRPPRSQQPAHRVLDNVDAGANEVFASRTAAASQMTGSLPSRTSKKYVNGVSGYGGYVPGKVAENMHGGTFQGENERALRNLKRASTAPTLSIRAPPTTQDEAREEMKQTRNASLRRHGQARGLDGAGMTSASKVPKHGCHVPGEIAESVHAKTPAETSHEAHVLRRRNPHVNTSAWMRKGIWPTDKRPLYKFTNRTVGTDTQHYFSNAEEEEYTKLNQRLGRTWGLNIPERNIHKPGDRYLHATAKARKKRLDPTQQPPAGQQSYSTLLDPERWKIHNTIGIGNGNQLTYS